MYDVRIGRTDLYGIISVSTSNSRDVATYDSIAGSKFSRPKNKNLINYTIEMQLSEQRDYNLSYFVRAKTIFKDFDKMLERGRPVRLIIYNEKSKLSELVYLERYDKEEKENGVYNVTVKCSEYAEAEVRTTNIPKIKRQGKIPAPPKQPVIVKNPYAMSKKLTGSPLPLRTLISGVIKTNLLVGMGAPATMALSPVIDLNVAKGISYLEQNNEPYTNFANIPNNKPVKVKYGLYTETSKRDKLAEEAEKTFSGMNNFRGNYFAKNK